jgi:hypothetical protein
MPKKLLDATHPLNLLKQEKTAKGGVHARQLQTTWNNEYFLKILVLAAAN